MTTVEEILEYDNQERTKNKYDVFLFLLIASFAFGGLGGSMQVPRILALLFMPQLAIIMMREKLPYLNTFFSFFVIWYAYSALSLLWTSDMVQAFKEMLYYPVHFLIFMEIVAFASLAVKPFRTISTAWVLAFLGTSVVALWEINTNNHLAISVHQAGYTMNNGSGEFLLRHFASVTFGNYNCYNIFICYVMPFIFYQILYTKQRPIWTLFCIVSLFFGVYFLLINGTRGGLLAFVVMAATFIFYSFRDNNQRNRLIVYVIILVSIFAVLKYGDILFETIRYRLYSTEITDTSTRDDTWNASVELFMNSYGIGTGVGSMNASLAESSIGELVVATHNIFLEILVQYGVLIFLFFMFFLFRIFMEMWKIYNISQRMAVVCSVLAIPFVSVVNSGYLLEPMVWGFFASLYVFTFMYEDENAYINECELVVE